MIRGLDVLPRKLVVCLVFAFPIFIVAFAVLMGGHALSTAADDQFGAKLIWWAAMFDLFLLVVDAILLIGALSVRLLLEEGQERSGHSRLDE